MRQDNALPPSGDGGERAYFKDGLMPILNLSGYLKYFGRNETYSFFARGALIDQQCVLNLLSMVCEDPNHGGKIGSGFLFGSESHFYMSAFLRYRKFTKAQV